MWRALQCHLFDRTEDFCQTFRERSKLMLCHHTAYCKGRKYSVYLDLKRVAIGLCDHHLFHLFKRHVFSSIVENEGPGWAVKYVNELACLLRC